MKKEIIINNFKDLNEHFDLLKRHTLCRGVPDSDFRLIPSIARSSVNGKISILPAKDIKEMERDLMWLFKTQANILMDKVPNSEIAWLIIAQHHGLPTRLLDWTLNPLIAAFFSVEDMPDKDGAIYIYDIGGFQKEERIDLNVLKDTKAIIPSHLTNRIRAQSSIFTVHSDNQMDFNDPNISKIIVPKTIKKKIMEKLYKYGINHASLFPNLDGLARNIKWLKGY